MTHRSARIISLIAALATVGAAPLAAQSSSEPPRVFLDCRAEGCDSGHIRNEIRFVDWMRDRNDADVYIIATSERTGGGGLSHRLTVRGSDRFAGDSLELRFATAQTSTGSELRDELTQRIAAALVRFAVLTDAAARIAIANRELPQQTTAPQHDPWNRWVFSAALSAQLDGESLQQEAEVEISLEAERITELWKFEFEVEGEHSWERFELSDRQVTSVRRDIEADLLLARAIAGRWSAGARIDVGTSTFANQDFYGRAAAVLEYSFLPYSDFSRRQVTLQYSLGARHLDYELETIYDRLQEQRADHQLSLDVNYRQPWGSAAIELSGAHYLHDLDRYNLSSFASFNVRLFRGLSVDLSARYERVRDQIYIPRGDATDEEVLLRRRALETGYRYATAIGLRYTFGSVYNNIVNPRLGF